MTMTLRHVSRKAAFGIAVGSAAVLLSTIGVHAATPDVADAAMRGDTAAIRRFLTQKADVNAPQPDGATALHWAVYNNDTVAVDLLLKAGANPKLANSFGATPLSLAAENGNAQITRRLVEAGADVNERMLNSDTPLMMAARTGDIDTLKFLLDRGADPNVKENARGTTALMWAASEGHSAAVQLLVDRGADVKVASKPHWMDRPIGYGKAVDPRPSRKRDNSNTVSQIGPRNMRDQRGGGLTPLAYAVRANDLASVKILLKAGADVNQATNYNWSPLLIATQNRHYQLGAFLLDNGADPNLVNKGDWSPLYIAVDNRNIEGGDYPLRKPDMDHFEFIKKLVEKGAKVNHRVRESTWFRTVFTSQWVLEQGATAFWRAAQSSDLEVMRYLLDHGADPNISTVHGVSPLQVAAGIGWVEGITYEWSKEANLETVKLLIELGNDVNQQAETGRTALHGAGHKGATQIIQALVDAGAKLDIRDYGMNGNDAGGRLREHAWLPVDYADGLIRIGTQSAIIMPEAGALLRKLMIERGLPAPPAGRTLETVCVAPEICDDVVPEELFDLNATAKK